jgi:hypothetical protein
MRYKITTPTGHTLYAEEDDELYISTLVAKGYDVQPIVIHRKPFEECESCSA